MRLYCPDCNAPIDLPPTTESCIVVPCANCTANVVVREVHGRKARSAAAAPLYAWHFGHFAAVALVGVGVFGLVASSAARGEKFELAYNAAASAAAVLEVTGPNVSRSSIVQQRDERCGTRRSTRVCRRRKTDFEFSLRGERAEVRVQVTGWQGSEHWHPTVVRMRRSSAWTIAFDSARARQSLDQAEALLEEGRLDEAAAALAQAEQFDPHGEGVHALRGMLLLERREFERARAEFYTEARLFSEAYGTALAGWAFHREGRYAEARDHYSRAIGLSSGYAWALAQRAEVYRALGDGAAAEEDARRACAMDASYCR